MTNDLSTKATALLEARQKIPHAEPFGAVEIQEDFPSLRQPRESKIYGDTAKYLELAANTAPEIITGFQQLLKEKDALIQTLEDENEMLTESNEHLMKCEGERNDLRKLVRGMLDTLEDVTKRFEEAIEGGRREIIGDRQAIAKARSFLGEAKAALPPA